MGVGVGIGVLVAVGVSVAVAVAVAVGVGVGVRVWVAVGAGVGVGMGVCVAGIGVGVGAANGLSQAARASVMAAMGLASFTEMGCLRAKGCFVKASWGRRYFLEKVGKHFWAGLDGWVWVWG